MTAPTKSPTLITLRRWRPYPAYKDSGMEWLGEIPAHWDPLPLGRAGRFTASGIDKKSVEGEEAVQMVNYTDVYSNASKTLDSSRNYMQTTCPAWKAKEHSLHRGDILFTPSSETEAEVGFSAVVIEDMSRTVYSYHLIRFRPLARLGLDLGFGKYFANNRVVLSQFSAACKGTTRQILTREDFRGVVVVLPPIKEQHSIATFLDHETARIDALVAKRERQIELLQEKRAALITQAVTKGLNPKVPMKDSGVEWFSTIPLTWAVKRLKYAVPAITVGIVVTPSKYYTDTGIPCFRSFNIADRRLDTTDLVFISPESNELHRKSQIHEGDVLVVRTGRTGTAAIVPKEFDGANCVDLLIVRRSEKLLPSFLWFLLNSAASVTQIEAHSEGAIQAHYNTSTLAELLVTIPPAEEQRAIIAFLDRETDRIDALITKLRAAITLLQEYRTALISAAVTGKIDVRSAT